MAATAESVAASAINLKVSNFAAQNAVDSVSDDVLGAEITRTPLSIRTMAADMIGSEIGNYAMEPVNKESAAIMKQRAQAQQANNHVTTPQRPGYAPVEFGSPKLTTGELLDKYDHYLGSHNPQAKAAPARAGVRATSQSSLNAGASGKNSANNWNSSSTPTKVSANSKSGFWNSVEPKSSEFFMAGLASVGRASKNLALYYGSQAERYSLKAQQAIEKNWDRLTDEFFNENSVQSPAASMQRGAALSDESRYNSGLSEEMNAFSDGAKIFRTFGDPLATAGSLVGAAVDVMNAPPQDKTETAFVDAASIAGARYGADIGIGLAFGEEGFAPVVSTPVAVATVGGSIMATSFTFRAVATGMWDLGHWGINEINQSIPTGDQQWNNSFGR